LKDKRNLPPINERIRAEQVQLITDTGENIGVVPTKKALVMADQAELDLVMIAESGKDGVPVAKIMDFGKVLYEKKKKLAESKKHQKIIQVKEIKIRPKIGDHDYITKMKQAVQFLKTGKRVKFTLVFQGRENITKDERGKELFEQIDTTLQDAGLDKDLVRERDARLGKFWSRVYYLK